MGATQFSTRNLGLSSVNKDDVDVVTSGKALITKVIAGTGISFSSTGVDAGTGDVTINGSPLTETALADGFSIAGGTISRTLTVTSGSPTITAGGSATVSLPLTTCQLIGRVITVASSNQSAGVVAGIDYIYLMSGTFTVTLPTGVNNTNRYTVKNVGSGITTVAFTGGQTGDGNTTIDLAPNSSIDLISNNSNFFVI